MIQRLHKLSPLLSFMFVRCSGNLIVHLWQGGVGSLDLRSSRALIFSNISVGTFFGSQSDTVFCSACQSLYCISPRLPFQVDVGTMLYRGDCNIHLQTNEDW